MRSRFGGLPEVQGGEPLRFTQVISYDGPTLVEGVGFDDPAWDDETLSAVVREFEIMSEAPRQIPDELRQRHPRAP